MTAAKSAGQEMSIPFRPQYVRIEEELSQQIASGKLAPGERLPDERLLAEQFKVSRGTIRQALERLSQSHKVERHQGRGTFVAQVTEKAGYLCVVAVGETARDTLHVATTIAQTEELSRQFGLKVSVRYAPNAQDLRQVAAQVNADRTIAAAFIIGVMPPCDLAKWTHSNRVSWTMLAEVASSRRDVPAIDQVVPDWYDLHQMMAQYAIDHGSQRPALWVLGKQWVWSTDSISAFRATCDAAGLNPADLNILDLHTYRTAPVHSTDEYHRALSRIMLEKIDQWSASKDWPDHIIAPGTSVQTWLECLRARPKTAEKLLRVPLVAWTLKEHHQQVAPPLSPIHTTWAHISVADQVRQALARLFENTSSFRLPMRDYVRGFELVECPPTQLE